MSATNERTITYRIVITQHDITRLQGVVFHLDMADSNAEAQDPLEPELDGGAGLSDVVGEVLGGSDRLGAFASASAPLDKLHNSHGVSQRRLTHRQPRR